MHEKRMLNGACLHIMKTAKFKNTIISIKFKNELNREQVTKRTLLSMCLLGGTSNLPTQQDLAVYLENCYGANIYSNVSTKGKAHIVHLTSSFVNERFIPNADPLFRQQVDLMYDVLFNPLLSEKVLRQKKREFKDRLAALKDDKQHYALDRLLDEMGKDSTLGVSGIGYEEDLDEITTQDMADTLNTMLDLDEIEIYVLGDVLDEQVSYLENKFNFKQRSVSYPSSYAFEAKDKDVKEVIETQDITQAKYVMGFEANVHFLDDMHEAMTVMNGILGAYSHSRLFKNVREKHSLCYYIASSYDAFNGIVLVSCGIEGKEASRVKSLVLEEIEDLQKGNISDEELLITKRMFENSLRKSQDEPGQIIGLQFNRDIVKKEETIDEYLNKLMAVTKEEVVACARLLKLNTTFLLEGGASDGEEVL